MKSLTQKLVVSGIIALLMAPFIAAEESSTVNERDKELERQKIEVTQQDGQGRLRGYYGGYGGYGAQPAVGYGGYGGGYGAVYGGGLDPRTMSPGTVLDKHSVLVIPSGQIKPEKLAQVVEDMSVMSRIFDKELQQGGLIEKREGYQVFAPFFGRDVPEIRSIYIEGYGALFLINVDFPLSPPGEVEQGKTDESGVDKIWEQARRELYSGQERQQAESGCPMPEYDADKVATLKTKLTRVSLKHASNIRGLGDDEWIVVAVSGWGGRVREARLRFQDRTGKIMPHLSAEKTDFTPRTVLVIRARKADVDLFAGGELNWELFLSKLETVMY